MNWKVLYPKSLVSRTLWLTLLAVFLAQVIATAIWYSQSKQRDLDGLQSTSASMATMFASTVTFFQSLPMQYRHIVLDQLRNMGGTRFLFLLMMKKFVLIRLLIQNKNRWQFRCLKKCYIKNCHGCQQ